ncbi:MAG: hypothetical protein ABSA93_09220 [Streptosporangiaceae bacterium]|jgi:hypothetical protein
MNKVNDPLKVVFDLEPEILDSLTDDGYRRNRHDDLARMAAEGSARARKTRRFAKPRWSLAAGGLAVAGAVAVAVTGAFPAARAASAHGFLMTKSVVAARSQPVTGTYWYVKKRDYEPAALTKAFKAAGQYVYSATYAATEESWTGLTQARTIVNEDPVYSFPSPADKSRWEADGEPPLSNEGGPPVPVTSNYPMTLHWGVGSTQLTMAEMLKLPTTVGALEKVIMRMDLTEIGKPSTPVIVNSTFTDYLVQWADVLLSGPARPGTKASIYRLLADQPGLHLVTGVTDPLHRTGVAVGDGAGDYLVIDPETAQLLAYVSHPVKENSVISGVGVEVYIATGWTSQLGVRP